MDVRVGVVKVFGWVSRQTARVGTIVAEIGGGETVTADLAAPAGECSVPSAGDFTVLVPAPGEGKYIAVAFVDGINEPNVAAGERVVYSRDAAGALVASIYLKTDGSVEVANSEGSITLEADGEVNINGVRITADGELVVPSSIEVGGKELANHLHNAGTPPGTTGPNL